ncbi:MAG: VCBS repeat-containing protein [Acidobacteriota bacterium]
MQVAVGDLDGDGADEIVSAGITGSLGQVFAFDGDGSMLTGWPQNMSSGATVNYAPPALADIDADGQLEVISGDQLGKVWAWNGNGTPVPNWPRPVQGIMESGLAIGDIDADGWPEIVATSSGCCYGGDVTVWHGDGTLLPGFPVTLSGGWANLAAAIGDVDGDGARDIVVPTMQNALVHALRADGSPVAGFPIQLPSGASAPPLLGDLDGDGDLELVVLEDTALHAFQLPGSSLTIEWSQSQGDARHTGRYHARAAEAFVTGEGPGTGNPTRVRVFDAAGTATVVDFDAYGAGSWGVNVASGHADPGVEEILTGPGPGPVYGPQVRSFRGTGAPIQKVRFFAYATLRYGVEIATGAVDGGDRDAMITGAGPGTVFGPHVRMFEFDGTSILALPQSSYFAYATLKYGAKVGSGDVDRDGFAELLTGPGPGPVFAPLVRGWNYDGMTISAIQKIHYWAFATPSFGCRVAGGDVDSDAFDEIAATPGPGTGPAFQSTFSGFDYDGRATTALPGFLVTAFTTEYGGRLALEQVGASDSADLVAGAGGDPAADSTVTSYWYDGQTLRLLSNTFLPFGPAAYGVTVSAGSVTP